MAEAENIAKPESSTDALLRQLLEEVRLLSSKTDGLNRQLTLNSQRMETAEIRASAADARLATLEGRVSEVERGATAATKELNEKVDRYAQFAIEREARRPERRDSNPYFQ